MTAQGHDKFAVHFTGWAGNVSGGKINQQQCSKAGRGWSSRNKWS